MESIIAMDQQHSLGQEDRTEQQELSEALLQSEQSFIDAMTDLDGVVEPIAPCTSSIFAVPTGKRLRSLAGPPRAMAKAMASSTSALEQTVNPQAVLSDTFGWPARHTTGASTYELSMTSELWNDWYLSYGGHVLADVEWAGQ